MIEGLFSVGYPAPVRDVILALPTGRTGVHADLDYYEGGVRSTCDDDL